MKNGIFKASVVVALLGITASGCSTASREKADSRMPLLLGETLLADDSVHVNAHGGMIMEKDGVFYWYGEHRGDGTPGSMQQGVSLYTSSDLRNWKNRGIVLQLLDSVGNRQTATVF